jgi:hypothetical protein
MLRPCWGVLTFAAEGRFERLRDAQRNHEVEPETLVRLLWRAEAHSALRRLGLEPEANAGRFQLWELLLETLDNESLSAVVREALSTRDAATARIPSRRFTINAAQQAGQPPA